jgi:hypothetical protein
VQIGCGLQQQLAAAAQCEAGVMQAPAGATSHHEGAGSEAAAEWACTSSGGLHSLQPVVWWWHVMVPAPLAAV